MTKLLIEKDIKSKNLPPLSGNIYCIGRNYSEHIAELNNASPSTPVVFLKSPSALRDWNSSGVAFEKESFHHEIELVLFINSDKKIVTPTLECISAVTLGIDLTRREVQTELKNKKLPWTISKNFQGSAILGPWVKVDQNDLEKPIDLELHVNGECRQSGTTKDMIFSCEDILKYLHSLHPLENGDIIYTGTPSGVNKVQAGDKIRGVSKTLNLDISGVL